MTLQEKGFRRRLNYFLTAQPWSRKDDNFNIFKSPFDIRREKQYSYLRFGSIYARTETSHFHHSFFISAEPSRQKNHDENEPFQSRKNTIYFLWWTINWEKFLVHFCLCNDKLHTPSPIKIYNIHVIILFSRKNNRFKKEGK